MHVVSVARCHNLVRDGATQSHQRPCQVLAGFSIKALFDTAGKERLINFHPLDQLEPPGAESVVAWVFSFGIKPMGVRHVLAVARANAFQHWQSLHYLS